MRFLSQAARATLTLYFLTLPGLDAAHAQWQSNIVRYEDGQLRYERVGPGGDRIPDFSYAGYRNGRPIPNVSGATIIRVQPRGDSPTAGIQEGIDRAAAWLDNEGEEGEYVIVQLAPGTYTVTEPIYLNASFVLLRGAGDGLDPATSTIIRAVGDASFERVLIVGSGRWTDYERGRGLAATTSDVVEYVEAGSSEVPVRDVSGFQAGDHVLVVNPCTQAWLEAIDGGGVSEQWTCREDDGRIRRDLHMVYDRYVESVDQTQNTLLLDAPIYNRVREAVDAGTAEVALIDDETVRHVQEVGLESLRVAISFDARRDTTACGGEGNTYFTDEDHPSHAVFFHGIENAWVQDVTASGFVRAGIEFRNASRITVDRMRAIEPAGIIVSPRRYNFNVSSYAQLILIQESYAQDARHAFVVNGGATASGIVFLRNVAEGSINISESHRSWGQGLLFDNHREIDPNTCNNGPYVLGLHNRADSCRSRPTPYCTYHGWSATNSVVWNSDIADGVLVLNRPPIGQNYAIGVRGRISAENKDTMGTGQPLGYVEGNGRDGLLPGSLYEAQLADRMDREQ